MANSAERLRQRGTAAHNTVIVDGEDSTEVWEASQSRGAQGHLPLGAQRRHYRALFARWVRQAQGTTAAP